MKSRVDTNNNINNSHNHRTLDMTQVPPALATTTATTAMTTDPTGNNNSTATTMSVIMMTATTTATATLNGGGGVAGSSVSTPADTLLLGEVVVVAVGTGQQDSDGNYMEELGVVASTINGDAEGSVAAAESAALEEPPLSEPTQWEKFADSIVKNHLDKRKIASSTKEPHDDHATTEQNIEL